MNDEPTGKALTTENRTDWERLQSLPPDAIHAAIGGDPDAHPTDDKFWEMAHVVMPSPKETITIRLDTDLLSWLRKQGRGYQTRINAILRTYMEGHR